MKLFDLSMGTVLLRFYLMMAIVICSVLAGYWVLSLLALPVFLSIMLGMNFRAGSTHTG